MSEASCLFVLMGLNDSLTSLVFWKMTCVNTLEIVNGTLTPLDIYYPY